MAEVKKVVKKSGTASKVDMKKNLPHKTGKVGVNKVGTLGKKTKMGCK